MKVCSTRSIGFCQGVKQAVELAEAAVKKNPGRIFSIGPIIHNPPEMERLARLGLRVVEKIEDIPARDWLVIRSHGTTPAELEAARRRELQIIDTTCEIVKRLQAAFLRLVEEGYTVFILGDRDHPEVQGVLSRASRKGRAVGGVEELEKTSIPGKVGVLAQTTQSIQKLEAMVAWLVSQTAEIKVINTLCPVTLRRQQEAWDLAKQVDTMLVIGGKNSANTSRLYELCRKANPDTFQVEQSDEIFMVGAEGEKVIGITAGTSTPTWLIEKVKEGLARRSGLEAGKNLLEKEE